jgi:hypothetical protein
VTFIAARALFGVNANDALRAKLGFGGRPSEMEEVRMKRINRRSKLAAALVATAALAATVPAGVATAKISPPSCETGSGQTPPGQQPVCKGGGLTQNPALNPAGQAPPGQQP